MIPHTQTSCVCTMKSCHMWTFSCEMNSVLLWSFCLNVGWSSPCFCLHRMRSLFSVTLLLLALTLTGEANRRVKGHKGETRLKHRDRIRSWSDRNQSWSLKSKLKNFSRVETDFNLKNKTKLTICRTAKAAGKHHLSAGVCSKVTDRWRCWPEGGATWNIRGSLITCQLFWDDNLSFLLLVNPHFFPPLALLCLGLTFPTMPFMTAGMNRTQPKGRRAKQQVFPVGLKNTWTLWCVQVQQILLTSSELS